MVAQFSTASLTDGIFKEKGCIADSDTCSSLTISATLGDQRAFTYTNSCCTTDKCNQRDLTREYSSSLCPTTCSGLLCLSLDASLLVGCSHDTCFPFLLESFLCKGSGLDTRPCLGYVCTQLHTQTG